MDHVFKNGFILGYNNVLTVISIILVSDLSIKLHVSFIKHPFPIAREGVDNDAKIKLLYYRKAYFFVVIFRVLVCL